MSKIGNLETEIKSIRLDYNERIGALKEERDHEINKKRRECEKLEEQ